MNSQTISTTQNTNLIALFTALMVGFITSILLYYIDEGNYHLNGLSNPLEWIAVGIYTAIFSGCIYLIYTFFKKLDMPFKVQLVLSVVLGLIALPLLIILISGILRFSGAF